MRTFIAIEFPHTIQDKLLDHTAALQQKVGDRAVRWVNVHNIHLTLKFLGEIHPAHIELLKQTMQIEARQAAPFSVTIGGLGAFPSTKRPRVIWIGLQAPAALGSLQRSLEGALIKIGYPADEKPCSPHLTIGRVSQKVTATEIQTLRTTLEETHVGQVGTLTIDAIHLFKSDLQSTGAVYTRLFSAKFGG